MDTNNVGTYHLAANPALYEPQRNNNFEFVVTDINNILRAGVNGTEANARIQNAQEILRMSVVKAPIPHFSQGTIEIRRGNNRIYAAGVPEFKAGQLVVNDFIGADTKAILMAWQNLSYNQANETVGSMSEYKKKCYLIEYTPDYKKVRQWVLYGCWISDITEDDYDNESNNKKQVQATITYDRGCIDYSDLE